MVDGDPLKMPGAHGHGIFFTEFAPFFGQLAQPAVMPVLGLGVGPQQHTEKTSKDF